MAQEISRRTFLTSVGVAGLGLAGYAHFIEPAWLEIGRHTLETRGGADRQPIKLLHLADLHASWAVSLDFIGEAIELGLQTKPDVICITGDFITRKFAQFEPYSRLLARLSSAAPAFATLGNHDGGLWSAMHGGYKSTEKVRDLLKQSRLELLDNRCASLCVHGRDLKFIGLGDWWAGDFNPYRAFGPPQPSGAAVRIVLSHNPDTKEFFGQYDWELLLSGHTHGGQFQMPLIGAPFAPVKDRRFIAGMYEWNHRRIHITKGVGNVYGLRLNCRPEVSLITIV
jgi:predicted MPP superfamily phosphohydrolase